MKTSIPPNYSSIDAFRLLVDNKMIDHIVCETNKSADQENNVPKDDLKAKLRCGEMIAKECQDGIVALK